MTILPNQTFKEKDQLLLAPLLLPVNIELVHTPSESLWLLLSTKAFLKRTRVFTLEHSKST